MKKKIKHTTNYIFKGNSASGKSIPPREYPFECFFSQKKISSQGDNSWSMDTFENTFLKITPSLSMPDITSIHDFKPGDKVFLVWIEYSTGNSFISEISREVLPIALLKNLTDAEKLKNKELFWSPSTKYDAKEFEEYRGSFFLSSDGQRVHFPYAPWTGYFEKVEKIHIQEVEISQS